MTNLREKAASYAERLEKDTFKAMMYVLSISPQHLPIMA